MNLYGRISYFRQKKELQEIGQSEELELQMASIKHQLSYIQRCKIQGQKIRAGMNWIDEGDKGSGYFLTLLEPSTKENLLVIFWLGIEFQMISRRFNMLSIVFTVTYSLQR